MILQKTGASFGETEVPPETGRHLRNEVASAKVPVPMQIGEHWQKISATLLRLNDLGQML
jgi:hypothetical protein